MKMLYPQRDRAFFVGCVPGGQSRPSKRGQQEVQRLTAVGHTGPALQGRESACRGRCPHRPEAAGAGNIPVTPRQRAAEIGAGSMRKQGLICAIRLRKVTPTNGKEGCVRETQEGCPSPFKSSDFRAFRALKSVSRLAFYAKRPKPWVLAAFFGYFLSPGKESTTPTTKRSTHSHASDIGHWFRMTKRGRRRSLAQNDRSCSSQDVIANQSADWCGNPRPLGGQGRPPLRNGAGNAVCDGGGPRGARPTETRRGMR